MCIRARNSLEFVVICLRSEIYEKDEEENEHHNLLENGNKHHLEKFEEEERQIAEQVEKQVRTYFLFSFCTLLLTRLSEMNLFSI